MEAYSRKDFNQASCWESRLQRRANASPLQPPARSGRRGNYIIWSWNESTLQAKVSEMLYCSWNCQLKSNTWNTEARLKQPCPLRQACKQPVLCTAEAPRECFSFRPFFACTPSLFVKSCRQCTFTLAYVAHKSPRPDVLLNVLIKPISLVEHMARLQCKPAQGTLLKRKTVMILSSAQSTLL